MNLVTKGDDKLKKYLVLLTLIFSLLTGIIIPTSAANKVEIQEQIDAIKIEIDNCIAMKDKSHEMAECARFIGFSENDSQILLAKQKWNEFNDKQMELENKVTELEKQLADMQEQVPPPTTWTGPKLTRSKGVNYGPVGKETYYNLNMSGVVRMMRNRGYDSTNYPYWVRSDGCKMLGPYIMLAANLNHFSRGSIVECSLGWGIVCDTGHLGYNQLDIAVTW